MNRLLLIAVLVLLPAQVQAQTICQAPDRCMSRARVEALVDAKCLAYRARAEVLPEVQKQRDDNAAGWNQCRGALLTRDADLANLRIELEELREQEAARWPAWVPFALGVALGAGGVVGLALAF